ncbi:MAG: CYTH domain-containing protein [Zoogloeaceae bacterium]|jgi:inorganic triphosphatase YgiF|nr:CYTH domain-containing protein [Zoogloeaceae bacterium]
MPYELEIKLALPVRLAPRLRRLPLLVGARERKRCLRNLYLDTPEQDLRRRGMALRRRAVEDSVYLTLKTEGECVNGLSRRQEWEYPCPPDTLDFSRIDDLRTRRLLQRLAPRLSPLFRMDFIRQSWDLPQGDSRVELALDLGYIRAGGRRAPIREVELELLAGREADILSLAKTLAEALPLYPFSPSKAARGYALLAAAYREANEARAAHALKSGLS